MEDVGVWDAQVLTVEKRRTRRNSRHDDAIRNDLCLLFLEYCDA